MNLNKKCKKIIRWKKSCRNFENNQYKSHNDLILYIVVNK